MRTKRITRIGVLLLLSTGIFMSCGKSKEIENALERSEEILIEESNETDNIGNEVNTSPVKENNVIQEKQEEVIIKDTNKSDQASKDSKGTSAKSVSNTMTEKKETSKEESIYQEEKKIDKSKVNMEEVPIFDIYVDDVKKLEKIEHYKTIEDYYSEKVISVENSLSYYSKQADKTNLKNYKVDHHNVFKYTYDLINGCWSLTKTRDKKFNLYSINDEGNNSKYYINSTKMRRCYLDGGVWKEEYLNTEDCFYRPYEDNSGNIYAECGKQPTWERGATDKVYIKKLNSKGKTLAKVEIKDYFQEGLNYLGFLYIKKDMIALIFEQKVEESKYITQVQFIDISKNKLIMKINLQDKISLRNLKSDGDYFIIGSESNQKVYVFDANTFKLINTIDTTLCKELCSFEFDPYSELYDKFDYMVDINNGKVYFLRHSGIFVTDVRKSEFHMLLDGAQYKDFLNQIFVYSSFLVGKDEDFYILGVGFDEESATDLWHYTLSED